jgi:hypothetical protein
MNGLLDKFDLALKTDIDRLPKDRRLYEIDSYDWLSAYPTHWNPIHLRLRLLFGELWPGDGPEPFLDTTKWQIKNVPNANGYKTILSVYFLLQEQTLDDPITINYLKRPNSDPQIMIEPGKLRVDMLPYMPNHKIRIATFGLGDYLPKENEISFDNLVDLGYYVRTGFSQPKKDVYLQGIYKKHDVVSYWTKCQQQGIVITYDKKGMYINNKRLVKRKKDGSFLLDAPLLYKGK